MEQLLFNTVVDYPYMALLGKFSYLYWSQVYVLHLFFLIGSMLAVMNLFLLIHENLAIRPKQIIDRWSGLYISL